MDIAAMLVDIRVQKQLSHEGLAQLLHASRLSVIRWEQRAATPSPEQATVIEQLHRTLHHQHATAPAPSLAQLFASRGAEQRTMHLPLFDAAPSLITLSAAPHPPLLERLTSGPYFNQNGQRLVCSLIADHAAPATLQAIPPTGGMSAGKNTYTYDAHTYHTKVPPQGIAELIKHYLPEGGLVLDPFGGSGMTGVACRVTGHDCIINELSPAASFIASRFVAASDPLTFQGGIDAVLDSVRDLRAELYRTSCRECGKPTEILYTVWSYNVLCNDCGQEFLLWDHCRSYGQTVRDHKILKAFPCPHCGVEQHKSRLQRTFAEPVLLGYKCCGSKQQEVTHPLDQRDLELLYLLELAPPLAIGFFPNDALPPGVNLRQPQRHGLTTVDRFYTPRNLAALSHLWHAIHCIEDVELAAQIAFVFTSLYQRVTRLAEFRFWGGSGNTARFNVPHIFNEANVFATFERKARTIRDHLATTASHYQGRAVVVNGSATKLDYIPDNSIDLVFTDPPFGANINYSDMNFLWEAWLGRFTDQQNEAIVNKVQHKGIAEYQQLMEQSLRECQRVLRPGHPLLLVFMNSSKDVWEALRQAIERAGFQITQVDAFDKQHGTFKQFVSPNTAGMDLVLHCIKPATEGVVQPRTGQLETAHESITRFLESTPLDTRVITYLHVARAAETDMRGLYSEWLAWALLHGGETSDFAHFRAIVEQWQATHQAGN